jgi:hypothetical protein
MVVQFMRSDTFVVNIIKYKSVVYLALVYDLDGMISLHVLTSLSMVIGRKRLGGHVRVANAGSNMFVGNLLLVVFSQF